MCLKYDHQEMTMLNFKTNLTEGVGCFIANPAVASSIMIIITRPIDDEDRDNFKLESNQAEDRN